MIRMEHFDASYFYIKWQDEELILNLAMGQPDTLRADCYDTLSGFFSSADKI